MFPSPASFSSPFLVPWCDIFYRPPIHSRPILSGSWLNIACYFSSGSWSWLWQDFSTNAFPIMKAFSRRVFLQIIVSTAVIVPPVLLAYFLARPYLPSFFTKHFIALTWIFLFVLVVLINVGIAAGSFFKQWQKSADEKAAAEFEKRKAELELVQAKQRQAEIEMRALRAQMNPHFIFNSLNSINKYILKSEHENASRYLTRFAKLIRLILDNSNSREVALTDELTALKLYIEMESLRFTSKFDYEIKVSSDVNADTLQVPPLIIQPYVENAIWHGLLHKDEGGCLSISINKLRDDMLQCIIEDNGIGRKRATELKSKSAMSNKSLGMKLTEERIQMLNQYAASHASVTIIDLEDEMGNGTGTRVILNIPV
jgi:sensor histidine kinase YesM